MATSPGPEGPPGFCKLLPWDYLLYFSLLLPSDSSTCVYMEDSSMEASNGVSEWVELAVSRSLNQAKEQDPLHCSSSPKLVYLVLVN